MDTLLIAKSDRVYQRLTDALRDADHAVDRHADVDAAESVYDTTRHPLVFVEAALLSLRSSPPASACDFIDRSKSVLTAVVASEHASDGFDTALRLNADLILDTCTPASIAAHITLAERHARQRLPSPPSRPSSTEAPHTVPRPFSSSELVRILAQALDDINDSVVIADARSPDLPVIYCNPAFEKITGYPEEEIQGRNCRLLQGPDTDPEALEQIRNALREAQSCRTVLKNYRKDGTPFWNELTLSPIRNGAGQLTHYIGIQHDITERLQHQQQLEQNEQRLRQIVDALPQHIVLKDEAGTYVLVNQAVATFHGTTPEKLEGTTDTDFSIAGAGRDVRADAHEVLQSGQPKEFIETITDKHGREHVVRTKLSPFIPAYSDEQFLLSLSTDITEQVEAEEALRQERDLLDSIMSTSVAAIAVVDTAGQIIFANERAEEMLGLEPNPADGPPYTEPAWELTTPDGHPLPLEEHPFQRVRETGEAIFGVEHALEWPDGQRRLLAINAAPLKDDAGQVVRAVISIEDITERKQAEQALQASEERWRRLVKHHPEPILISTDAEIQYINPAGAQTFGASDPDDIIGRSVLEFAGSEAYDTIRDRKKTLEAGQRTEPFEHRLIRLDGEERIVQSFSVPITYKGRQSAQTVVRDVTEQKRAERELKIREHQQAVVAELGLYALEESDLQALMDEVTHRIAQTLDVEFCCVLELLPSNNLLRLKAGIGWADAPIGDATLRVEDDSLAGHTLHSEEPVIVDDITGETQFNHFPFLAECNPTSGISVVIQGSDRPYGILGAFTTEQRPFTSDDVNFLHTIAFLLSDAVERKRTEDELQLSEKRYRSVVEQQTELICRFTPATKLTFVNHAFCNYVGIAANRLVGRSFLALIPHSDHDSIREVLSDFTPETPVKKHELRIYDENDEVRWLQWAIRAFFESDGTLAEFQASGRDITERKQLEREILDVSTRERRRIGQDLHDGLGSHLSGVAMLCRGVIRKIEAGESVEKPVMEEIAQLVQESISQVRKLARGLNPVKMENQGLPTALQELASSAQAHPAITATFTGDPNLPDPDPEVALHLYRIAQEAVNNALKHAEAQHIEIHLKTHHDRLVLRVEDDGIGVPDRVTDLEGMGLRVMNYRANTIGAQLHIHDKESGGTLVQCTLPYEKLSQENLSSQYH